MPFQLTKPHLRLWSLNAGVAEGRHILLNAIGCDRLR
jgi:hypothetical protein